MDTTEAPETPAVRATDGLLDRLCPRDGVLDLRSVDWVRPAVMVGVAALAHRASLGRSSGFEVRAPTRVEPAGYAARMHLGSVLDTLGVGHDLPGSRRRDRQESLIELSVIEGDDAAAELAALVHRKVRPVDRGLALALHKSVGEIAANAPEHSGTIGYMAAQTLPRRNELLLAVGDGGVGMQATLAHRGASDDEQAIVLATAERVSRFDDADRGRGLPTAIALITGRRGSLYIATGTASVRRFATTRRFLRTPARDGLGCPGYPGTIVEARIPLS